MKNIYIILSAMLALSSIFTACTSDEDPFATVTADDEPRILDPTFPDRTNGSLATFANINRDANLSIKLTVTPADYTTVTWFIDGKEVESGTESDKELNVSLKAGTYNLKMAVATANGKATSREGIVQVNPLPDDPWATKVAFERIVAPGVKARFYGNNLDKVVNIVIGDGKVTEVMYIESEEGNYIEYSVPEDIAEGDFRAVFLDAEGNEYGADMVKVTKSSLITAGATRATSNTAWTISGINLDAIASLTIGDQIVSDFISQSSTEITLNCPELADGEYSMTGMDKNGGSVLFFNDNATVTEQMVTISTERTLWSGHHYVSWDMPDGDPNKSFNLIPKDVFADMKVGSTLRVTYSIEPSAEYHQMQLATGWWTGLADKIEFPEGGVYELVLTREMLDMIQAQDGFLCVGHGYYVDLVTLK